MGIKELILKINQSVEELDLVTTRKYIEENLDILNQNSRHLKSNARELLKFLTQEREAGHKPLTRAEIGTVQAINTYAGKFDVRSLKVTIKGKEHLLLRNDFTAHLNADAKIILQGMRAI